MRKVVWTDERGYRHHAVVRDNDPDSMAAYGIPLDPPDVEQIDWDFLKREIHNALADNGLFTWNDVITSPVGLNAAVTVVKRQLSGLYQSDQRQNKRRESSKI